MPTNTCQLTPSTSMSHRQERPKVGVGVLVIDNGKVLCGKRRGAHGQGTWAPPGGHLEFGETVEECATRELLEETGLRAISLKRGPWVNDIIEETKHYVTLYIFVDEFEGTPQLLEPDKCDSWMWFHWNALPTPLFPPMISLFTHIDSTMLTKYLSAQQCT